MNDHASNLNNEKGSALLESLIAILLFSLGILAVVGLQAAMVRNTTESRYRADAAYLASQIIGAMWLDTPNLPSYAYPGSGAVPDRLEKTGWIDRIHDTLPNGATGEISVNGSQVQVTVTWQTARGAPHRYVTYTNIAN